MRHQEMIYCTRNWENYKKKWKIWSMHHCNARTAENIASATESVVDNEDLWIT